MRARVCELAQEGRPIDATPTRQGRMLGSGGQDRTQETMVKMLVFFVKASDTHFPQTTKIRDMNSHTRIVRSGWSIRSYATL